MTDQTPPEPVEVDGEGTADLHRAEALLDAAQGISAESPGILATMLARSQVAAASAVVVQLQLVLAELRQTREDAAVALLAQAEPTAVRWSDTPRLLRMLGELAQDHHPADARRREQLANALEDVVERWAANR